MARQAKQTGRASTFFVLALSTGCGGQPGADPGAGEAGSGGVAGATAAGGSGGVASESGDGGLTGGAAGAQAVCSDFATGSPAHEFGPGQSTGQDSFSTLVLGPPKGGGCCQGSLDVVSLGNGGSVSLEFGATMIVDEPGPDFIVFENAFYAGGDPEKPFAELGTVAVSEDGETWTEFPCTAVAAPYGSCAGWHPIFANPDENALDPLDPAVAGGDAFDLGDIGVTSARFVRVTDRADIEGAAGVFDLDAVGVVHAECP